VTVIFNNLNIAKIDLINIAGPRLRGEKEIILIYFVIQSTFYILDFSNNFENLKLLSKWKRKHLALLPPYQWY
jgi:hypothetical protein